MIRALIPCAAGLALAACGPAPAPMPAEGPATVAVADAFCRPTQAGRAVTGCYMTLTAGRDDRLVSVATPLAAEVQIHEMSQSGGMMRMAELPDGLPLPARQAVTLRPGGDHIMLLGLARPLEVGDRLPLTLAFEQAPPQEVEVAVAEPPAPGG